MLLYKRKKPKLLQMLEAATPRLSPNSSKRQDLESDLGKEWKGYIGEKKVDFYLETLSDKFSILQGLYLKLPGYNVQIDSLIISPHAIYIVETKNFMGSITFDTTFNQFIRNDGQEEKGYRHPISQAELQALRISDWLYSHNYPPISVNYFVAVAEPNTIIKVNGDKSYIASLVAHGENIPKMILAKEKYYASINTPKIQHQKIGKSLLKENKNQDLNFFNKYNIQLSEILSGVHCPKCRKLSMKKVHGMWFCNWCNNRSTHAHLSAIDDYFLLINSSITNKEARRFLKVASRHQINRILYSSKLQHQNKKWFRN